MKNGSNVDSDLQPMMILTIDIGNGQVDKLQLYDLNNIDKETYDFCVKNKLDFNTMQEINTQIQNVLKDKQFEEEQENEGFGKIIEEEDEKITENNNNDKGHESIIMTNNSNEQETQKDNNNDNNNININENSINDNYSNHYKNNETDINHIKNDAPSIRSNSTMSYNNGGSLNIDNKNKFKKKSLKTNIKEAFAMAKKRTAQSQKMLNKKSNNELIKEKSVNNMSLNDKIDSNNNNEKNINMDSNNNININNVNDNNILNEDKEINEIKNENIISNNNEDIIENIKDDKNKKNININQENGKQPENNNILNDNRKYNNIINRNSNNDLISDKQNKYNINNINTNSNQNKNKNKSTKKKLKPSSSHNGSQIENYNIGKELYERGLKFKENEKEKLEVLKHNLQVDEEEDNTFAPKINKLSEIQKEKIKEKRLECNNPDIINNYRKYKQEKYEMLKKKKDEEFHKIYTFKPIINRSYSNTKTVKKKESKKTNKEIINNKMNNNNANSESRFDKLYNYRIDYKENKDKLKQKIYNEYSFKPQINENSSYFKLNKPFNERLTTYSNKTKENLVKIQKVYEREQGYNEPFKPQLNKNKNKILLKDREDMFSNMNNLNSNNNMDHYTKLYLYGKKYEQEKNYLTEKYYQEQNRPPQISETTEEIINRKKEKCFKEIFRVLDNDEDDIISAAHINISKLPKSIAKILEPIFNELKEENETLNEVEFIFVCEQLYSSLGWNEKRELTNFQEIIKRNVKIEKILKEKNNFSFEPKINKRNLSYDKNSNAYKNIMNNSNNINNNYSKVNQKNQKDGNGINYTNYNKYNAFSNKLNFDYSINPVINNKYNNNCYIKKRINGNDKDNKNKNKGSMNQINNKINYFNLKSSGQNSNSEISKINFINGLNNNINDKSGNSYMSNCSSKYSILKNINFNILGKNENDTESNNNGDKENKIIEKKINYDDFINVKNNS